MDLTVDNKTESVKLNPQNIIEELRQNIRMILLTFAGSCPLARELALDSGLIDKPVNIVENIIYANLKRAIEENEPRVNLKQINIKNIFLFNVIQPYAILPDCILMM